MAVYFASPRRGTFNPTTPGDFPVPDVCAHGGCSRSHGRARYADAAATHGSTPHLEGIDLPVPPGVGRCWRPRHGDVAGAQDCPQAQAPVGLSDRVMCGVGLEHVCFDPVDGVPDVVLVGQLNSKTLRRGYWPSP